MNATGEQQPARVGIIALCATLSGALALCLLLGVDLVWQGTPLTLETLFRADAHSLPRLVGLLLLMLGGLSWGLGTWFQRQSAQIATLTTELANQRLENDESQQRLATLLESEDRYHSLFDNAYDGMICLTTDGIITDVNQGQEALSGWSREQLLGCHYASFLTPASRAQVKERTHRLQAGEKVPSIYEQEVLRPDGSSLLVESQSRFIRNPQGKPIGVFVVSRDITARKRIEERLRFSEERFRSLSAASPIGIFVTDIHGQCEYTNTRWQQIYGLTLTESLGEGWATTLHPEDRNAVYTQWQQCTEQSLEYQQEFRLLLPHGEVRWVHTTARPIVADNGTVTGYVGISTDITERRRTEEQLRDSEERFRSLCAASPIGIFCNDAFGNCIYTNARWQVDYGLTLEESLGDRWLRALHPEDRQRTLDEWNTHIVAKAGFIGEYRIVKKSGDVRWMRVRTKPMFNAEGQMIGHVGMTEDITERRDMEEQLRASEMRFRTLCAASPIGIFIGDAEGASEYTNARWQQIYGLAPEDSLGKAWANVTHPDDREMVLAAWHAQTQQEEKFFQEFRLLTPQGKVRWVQVHAQPLTVSAEGVTGYVGTVEDITVRKQAEGTLLRSYVELERRVQERTHELAQAKEAAELANSAKSQFLANMSHELRTPMHAIIGFAKFGLKKSKSLSPDEQADNLTEICTSAENLLKLLNNLLDLSKLEAGQMHYEFHPNSPEAMVQAVGRELHPLLAQKHITLHLEAAISLPDVECDEGKMRQVLRNIIANAIKFTESQHTISVSSEVFSAGAQTEELWQKLPGPPPPLVESSGYMRVNVRDQGVGIPEEELESVFDKFVQSSKTKTGAGGTGLGLAICREIIQAHHGHIWAENNPSGGACISFILPLRQPRSDTPMKEAA